MFSEQTVGHLVIWNKRPKDDINTSTTCHSLWLRSAGDVTTDCLVYYGIQQLLRGHAKKALSNLLDDDSIHSEKSKWNYISSCLPIYGGMLIHLYLSTYSSPRCAFASSPDPSRVTLSIHLEPIGVKIPEISLPVSPSQCLSCLFLHAVNDSHHDNCNQMYNIFHKKMHTLETEMLSFWRQFGKWESPCIQRYMQCTWDICIKIYFWLYWLIALMDLTTLVLSKIYLIHL